MECGREILPGLWIGDYTTYKSNFTFNKNIKSSLNCNMKHKSPQVILHYLQKATILIHKQLKQLNNILLYSQNTQEACILATAYLIKYANITAICAMNLIKNKKPDAFITNELPLLKKILLQFEKSLKN